MKLNTSLLLLIGVLVVLIASQARESSRSTPQRPDAASGTDEAAGRRNDFSTSMDRVRQAFATIVDNAAEPEVGDTAMTGGIRGMLRTLDPHSQFFPPEEFQRLREQQAGTYSGLGITVSGRFGRVTVVSPPFPGAPAEKVGLRVGDVISHVDGVSIEGMPLDEVVSRLKGPKGTPVRVRIVRPGVAEGIDLEVVRAEISGFTVSNAFRLEDDIAYVKIDSFAETTGEELEDALNTLGPETLSGLILDLRGNPGGLMQEAIEVSELFLGRGERILETRGRRRDSAVYYDSRRSSSPHSYPLVVIIDRGSASASEIVAGAIQDHDRGLIVGEVSFGKGLVQSVFQIGQGAGLALTTQKWYTPSGRLIQRDYSQVSDFDYYNQPELRVERTESDIHYSDLGRVVYGGGGITPDVVVQREALNDVQDLLSRSFVFYTFVQERLMEDGLQGADLEVTDALLADFRDHAGGRGIELSLADLEANRDFVEARITYELVYSRYGVSEAARVGLDEDPQVIRAVELMPEAAALLDRARQARNAKR